MDYIDKIINQDGETIPLKGGCSKYGMLDGKRVCFIGDSITDSTYYPDEFCNLTGALEYNRGCSGSSLSCTGSSDYHSISSRIQWAQSDKRYYDNGKKLTLVGLPNKPHLFILYGGHNDWGNGRTFGDVSDTDYPTTEISFTANAHSYTLTVPTTYCGGCRFVFQYLKEHYPQVPVVALSYHHAQGTTFPKWNTYETFDPSTSTYTLQTKNDKTWRDYKDAFETIATEYGAYLVDLELIPFSPFNPDAVLWYKDGLHFAKPGAKKMAQYVADRVVELIHNLPDYGD